MSSAVCAYHLFIDDLAVSNVIELELLGSAKMLEYLPVFIGYCDSYDTVSFLSYLLRDSVVNYSIAFDLCQVSFAGNDLKMILSAHYQPVSLHFAQFI